VIVYGELTTREYTTKEGENRSADEIRVESIGKDLTFHGQAYAANDVPATQSQGGCGQAPNGQDPWAAPANSGGWGDSSGAPF